MFNSFSLELNARSSIQYLEGDAQPEFRKTTNIVINYFFNNWIVI